MSNEVLRIGILGGSFDPIHSGHLILAEQCRQQAQLDQVWFVPCAQQPLKDRNTITTDRQRCEMIELAIAGHESFHLSKIELERGGISYTVDTLEQIQQLHPKAQLFLLMGEDSLKTFSRWKSPERICELAIPLVVNRPGEQRADLSCFKALTDSSRYQQIESYRIVSPLIEVSSSDLRNKIAASQSVRYLLPRAVEKYIETQKLYQSKSAVEI